MKTQAILTTLLVSAITIAQPPQGKRGQRGDRSQREQTAPGGISWAAYGFNGLGIVRLLEVPEIQAELKFTNDDKSALPLLRDEFAETDAKYRKGLTDAAAQSKDTLREFLASKSKEVDRQMGEILGDRIKRFQEIRRQAFGVMASTTSDAVVRESLGITEDQRTKFNTEHDALLKKWREQMSQGKGKAASDDLDRGMRDFGAQEEKLFLSLLTDAQAAKWKELVGAPMEIPPEVTRFVRRARYEPAGEGDRPGAGIAKGGNKGFRKRGSGGNRPPAGEGEKKPPG